MIITYSNDTIICYDSNLELFINAENADNYYWYYNNSLISGANNNTLANISQTGTYTVVAENSFGTDSVEINVTINPLPVISLQDYNQCLGGSTNITASVSSGTPSYTYNWSQGGTSNNITVNPTDTTTYTLIVTDVNNCKDTAETSVNVLFPYEEKICMVTVDTLTGNNMIIWEKTPGMRTEKYKIYRESTVAGVYNIIGEQNYGDMSEFIDVTADPMTQAYKYKITTVDSVCANEFPIDNCLAHKTIHMQASQGTPNGYQLSWTEYEGSYYGTYNIYGRETGIGNFSLIHQTAYGNNTWTDLTTVPSMEYRISVYKAEPCVSSSDDKTNGCPYNQSISNIDDYSTGINDNLLSLNNIYVYPNPCTGVFTVRGNKINKIIVTDSKGKTVYSQNSIVEFNNIDLSNEAKGIYFVKLISETGVSTQKIVLE